MDILKVPNRYWRYILFVAGTAIVLWVFYSFRMVLLPFVIGMVLAFLLTPLVKWLELIIPGKSKHTGTRRILAIIIILFSIMGVLAVAVFFMIGAILHSSSQMLANSSQYIDNFITQAQQWTANIRNMFPESTRAYVDSIVQSIGSSISSSLQGAFSGSPTIILNSLGVVFGFAAVPLFVFYLLKDSELVVKGICSSFGKRASPHVNQVICIIGAVLGRYVRAQLLLSAILFAMTLIGLLVLGVPFALPLAFFNGISALVPILGVLIAGAVMVLVTLALAPTKVLFVIGLDIVVNLLVGMLLSPRVQASAMKIHPALVIILLVLAGYFWGIWGMIFTVPIAATLINIFKYIRGTDNSQKGEVSQSTAVNNEVGLDQQSKLS